MGMSEGRSILRGVFRGARSKCSLAVEFIDGVDAAPYKLFSLRAET